MSTGSGIDYRRRAALPNVGLVRVFRFLDLLSGWPRRLLVVSMVASAGTVLVGHALNVPATLTDDERGLFQKLAALSHFNPRAATPQGSAP